MRITDNRYSRDLHRYALAMRFIEHDARTHTICNWTGLSDDRVRNLFKSYSTMQRRSYVRHRGPSPQRMTFFLRSSNMRDEAAALAGLYYLFNVIPNASIQNARKELPCVSRGEQLCDVFETYCSLVPNTMITLEHAVLLALSLVQGNEIELIHCIDCSSLMMADRYGPQHRICGHCIKANA